MKGAIISSLGESMIEIRKNNLVELGLELVSFIKSRTNIFKTINIVVPSNKMEQWFKSYWLKTQNEILMNVKFEQIDDALLRMMANKDQMKLLNKDKMKVLIIKCLLEKRELINLPDDILNYIDDSKDNSYIKIYDLAAKLSELFNEYEESNIF